MARNLYESARMAPEDVDLIHVYDGYSPMVWNWLECLGSAERARPMTGVQGGRIALEGPNPVNTAGGTWGEGRLHGWSTSARQPSR